MAHRHARRGKGARNALRALSLCGSLHADPSAGLDVTNPEPLPKGHALWKFENVIITPHIATVSDGLGARQRELILDNVARFAKGEPLRNVVDKKKGY